jgi:hypothetical protein
MSVKVLDPGRGRTREGRARWFARSLCRGLPISVVLLLPLGSVASVIAANLHQLFLDFNGGLYKAGVAILHGRDPYRAGYLAHQAAIMRSGHIAAGETARHVFSVPLYPAAANLAVVPLSALPFAVAAGIYTVLSVAAMIGALHLLGVRDWRCYAMALISWPFLYGLVLGAIGPLIVLGAAAAWRWRGRVVAPALALATIVALKIFPWTLAVWLLVTRRWRTLAWTVALTALLTFGAWAIIGFDSLAAYPRMLSNATYLQEGRADSIATVLLVLGLSPGIAQAATLLAGLALLIVAWRLSRAPGGDRPAFATATIAALVATPLVWDHYMVLMFVPIALLWPRLSWHWALPVVPRTAVLLSYTVFPEVNRPGAYPVSALNSALCWLAAVAALTVCVTTTAEQRSACIAWLRHRPRRDVAPHEPAATA